MFGRRPKNFVGHENDVNAVIESNTVWMLDRTAVDRKSGTRSPLVALDLVVVIPCAKLEG